MKTNKLYIVFSLLAVLMLGFSDGFPPIVNRKFPVNIGVVSLDGIKTDEQFVGNLLVGQTIGYQLQYLVFSPGEGIDRVVCYPVTAPITCINYL